MSARPPQTRTAIALALLSACHDWVDCPTGDDVLESYEIDGMQVILGADGAAWIARKDRCRFAVQSFDPDFVAQHYAIEGDDVWALTEDGQRVPVVRTFAEDFERAPTFVDLIATRIEEVDRFWTGFTTQDPDHPEVEDYVALRACILDGTCDFTQNLAQIAPNPDDASDHVLRLTAVKPGPGMVTSKMSLESDLVYFVQGMDLWFQADYRVEGPLPYSLVDFENPYFEGSPGPRVVLADGALALENKFGEKRKFRQDNPVPVPLGAWFTVKVHLRLDHDEGGLVELWQDDELVLTATGETLPTYHAIQASLEVGISATDEATTLLVDDVHISDTPL